MAPLTESSTAPGNESKSHQRESLLKNEECTLPRMDGCTVRGEPDTRKPTYLADYIIDCGAQAQVYSIVLEAIRLLDELI